MLYPVNAWLYVGNHSNVSENNTSSNVLSKGGAVGFEPTKITSTTTKRL